MSNLLAMDVWAEFGTIIVLSIVMFVLLALIALFSVLYVKAKKKEAAEGPATETISAREKRLAKETAKAEKKARKEALKEEKVRLKEEKETEKEPDTTAQTEEKPAEETEVVAKEPTEVKTEEVAASAAAVEDGEDDEKSYHLPFAQKLEESDDDIKNYFKTLDEKLTSYKKVHSRISNQCCSYRRGRGLVAKITLRGKTLKLHLALNVNDFNKNVYFQNDLSAYKAYEEVPFAVKVKSNRGLSNALKLIEAMLGEKPAEVNAAAENTEETMAKKTTTKPAKPAKKAEVKEKKAKRPAGKWNIEIKSDNEYIAKLSAANGEVMLSSEIYSTPEGAKNGIATIEKAVANGEFIIYQDKSGDYYYKLKNANNRFLCAGEIYKYKDQCLKAVESVKRLAADSVIVDELVEGVKYADYKPTPNLKYDVKKGMEGKWKIFETEDGKYTARLFANNGQLMLGTEAVSSKSGATSAMEAVKKYAAAGLFVIDKDKFGRFYYKLRNVQKTVVCMGEAYDTLDACISALESVRRFAATAIYVED